MPALTALRTMCRTPAERPSPLCTRCRQLGACGHRPQDGARGPLAAASPLLPSRHPNQFSWRSVKFLEWRGFVFPESLLKFYFDDRRKESFRSVLSQRRENWDRLWSDNPEGVVSCVTEITGSQWFFPLKPSAVNFYYQDNVTSERNTTKTCL